MDINTEVVGRNVRRLRRDAGLTLRELSAKAHVSDVTLIRAEQGRGVGMRWLSAIAEALGTDVKHLAEGEPIADYSIIQPRLDECFFCGEMDAEIMPVFPDHPEECRAHGLMAAVCDRCAKGAVASINAGIVRRRGQAAYESIYGRHGFIKTFGRDYRRAQ